MLIDIDCVFACFLLFLVSPVCFILLYYVYDFIIKLQISDSDAGLKVEKTGGVDGEDVCGDSQKSIG